MSKFGTRRLDANNAKDQKLIEQARNVGNPNHRVYYNPQQGLELTPVISFEIPTEDGKDKGTAAAIRLRFKEATGANDFFYINGVGKVFRNYDNTEDIPFVGTFSKWWHDNNINDFCAGGNGWGKLADYFEQHPFKVTVVYNHFETKNWRGGLQQRSVAEMSFEEGFSLPTINEIYK